MLIFRLFYDVVGYIICVDFPTHRNRSRKREAEHSQTWLTYLLRSFSVVDENIDELSMKDTTDLMPSLRFCIMIVDTM